MLEAKLHEENSFLTLTYDNENLPMLENGLSTLKPEDPKNWMKRIRRKLAPRKIRFYMVGEYGDQSGRAHYHYALFNYPTCQDPINRDRRRYKGKSCECSSCKPLAETWKKGFIYNDELNFNTSQYIGQYVCKKMTNAKDKATLEWLKGRYPEFSRMSNRPGIGADSMDKIVEILETEHGVDLLLEGDVPNILKHGKKQYPLGRYLRSKIREKMGWKEKGCPEEVLQKLRQESQEEYMEEREKNPFGDQKTLLLNKNKQRVKNAEKRYSLYKPKKRSI
jgi:hypothetical protein